MYEIYIYIYICIKIKYINIKRANMMIYVYTLYIIYEYIVYDISFPSLMSFTSFMSTMRLEVRRTRQRVPSIVSFVRLV